MVGYGAGLGYGFGFGGLLAMLGCGLLVVGLVLLAVWAFGRLGGAGTGQGAAPTPPAATAMAPRPDALEVLRMRLARGEVSVEEYTAAKQALEAGQ